jgi:predicted peptidase
MLHLTRFLFARIYLAVPLRLIVLGLFGCGTVQAVSVDNFVARRYTNSNGVLPYRLFIPTNYTVGERFPLVLFMHGAGESGSDNRYQLVGQTGALIFASESNQLKYPSFMVAPQCPSGASWTDKHPPPGTGIDERASK